jgi:hypothetical protein
LYAASPQFPPKFSRGFPSRQRVIPNLILDLIHDISVLIFCILMYTQSSHRKVNIKEVHDKEVNVKEVNDNSKVAKVWLTACRSAKKVYVFGGIARYNVFGMIHGEYTSVGRTA